MRKMRIYVYIPEIASERESIRSDLHAALQEYYGNFSADDIKFFNNNNAEVYIMEAAKRAGAERDISLSIEAVIKKYLPEPKQDVNIKLNYQDFKPDFRPEQGNIKEDNKENSKKLEEFDYEKLAQNYQAEEPEYSFKQVILPKDVRDNIEDALAVIEYESTVLDKWGLRSIIPYATAAINFYGPPGTGKSMTAEAIAKKLKRKILRASYADIESKFHGEGPKMVKAIFHAAERDNAVLFIDEADSLLSKRLTNVTEASSQAINSMRSQLLISLEHFSGIVIFATNLVVNYDKAFLSRLISIEFKIPDCEARKAIWEQHVKGAEGSEIKIPLSDDVNIDELAKKYEFCGRDIKKSVLDACVSCLRQGREIVSQKDFVNACNKTHETNERLKQDSRYTMRPPTESEVKAAVQASVNNKAKIADIRDDIVNKKAQIANIEHRIKKMEDLVRKNGKERMGKL